MSEVREIRINESELRQRVAVHEAAHAVVGLDQGLEVGTVSIVPDEGGSEGRADVNIVSGEEEWMRFAIMTAAGAIGEDCITGGRILKMSEADRYSVMEVLNSYCSHSKVKHVLGTVLTVARASVRRRKVDIETLAKVLLDRRTLSGAEVAEIVKGAKVA
jgi:ATP-dependent Zn protease